MKMKGTRKNIIISGGGTAGHIHPALAVGKKLKQKDPDCTLTFVGSTRNLEKQIMADYKAHFIPLNIEGIKGRGDPLDKALAVPHPYLNPLPPCGRGDP